MTHPLDMSLSVTGWDIDPDILNVIRLEVFHSETFDNSFIVKLEFKNGTKAEFDIKIRNGDEMDVYDALTAAIRVPRLWVKQIEGDDAAPEA